MTHKIEVLGRDAGAETYRLAVHLPDGRVEVELPERLAGTRPSHQTVHEHLARDSRAILRAARARLEGRTPRAPYDTLTLIGEPTNAD
ncbi:hypothetical protein AADZ90_012890 [Aestuariibius sp. 2305UL40-4]|uniref:hypothetical protein n=1 Tax=Aestuariibius violaceus TaxID=3234132 RepID=UPI00345ED49E